MHTNPLAKFGQHLAHLRKARGWSQEKLALESGLARSYVSGIERGRRNVALINICVLADTLGVSSSEMLNFPADGSTETVAVFPGDRTPVPMIHRALRKLDEQDQAWVAEVIRSLSTRLVQTPNRTIDACVIALPHDSSNDAAGTTDAAKRPPARDGYLARDTQPSREGPSSREGYVPMDGVRIAAQAREAHEGHQGREGRDARGERDAKDTRTDPSPRHGDRPRDTGSDD
ncbi:helix-hairpin-helix DNA-binding motif-containing protein [Pandoraea terrae]|uniref:Helix-hairpin-helix DNA-binding motif-containing protein n=1 Tax=Pandoraea terrae TaxID=1537710 RepID=A0A5E4VAI7_9BURK|nr:helix-hairpin-helix DNA-binding motif-containing protein [Pandoraea terrae]